MKDPTIMALSAAGLLHDLGKFAERAGAVGRGDADEIRQDYNYAHAWHTAQALENCFGEIVNRSFNGSNADENLNNLASRHHKPRTDLEKILQKADWVASGHERREADQSAQSYETEGRERKSQVPLIAMLGRVSLQPRDSGHSARYQITTLSDGLVDPEKLYPVPDADYSADEVRQDYAKQWQAFHAATAVWRERQIDPAEQINSLLDLLQDFLWCVPASTRVEELPDVSLFEHNKGVAALASALYQYQQTKSRLLDDLGNDQEQKFLLCGCDISGIQNFIYQISSKGAYRHLKGRSFYIQLLADIVARDLLAGLGLTAANLVYASGGKAYLLLANTEQAREKLAQQHSQINRDLYNNFGHDLYLRLASEPLSVKDLCRQQGRTLSRIWQELTERLGAQSQQRLKNLDTTELARMFTVDADYPFGDCQICHAPLKKEPDICPTCNQLGELGRKLGSAEAIHLIPAAKGLFPGGWNASSQVLQGALDECTDGRIYRLNQLAHTLADSCTCSLMVGGNQHPKDDFESIADESHGVKRLGILRMDVDNLGSIFSNGLKNYVHGQANQNQETPFYSLGRVTTLSWQLSTFFSVVLRHLVEHHPQNRGRVSIVYAGGDDLFILGAWDALPSIADEIRTTFHRYCAGNPDFSLSGGLVLTSGKFPIYKGAELAGEAEHKAKVYKRDGIKKGSFVKKRALCFFDTALDWDEFKALHDWFERLAGHCSQSENRPLLKHLQRIADVWEGLRQHKEITAQRQGGNTDLRQIAQAIAGEKWCWQLVYSLSRYARGKGTETAQMVEELKKFTTQTLPNSPRQGIELLGLLCRWTELYLRKTEHATKGGQTR